MTFGPNPDLPFEKRASRRKLVGAAAALGTGAMFSQASAHTGSPGAPPVDSPVASLVAAGEWTFTDDKGVTVTLPSRPMTIVADLSAAAPLWDFGIRPVAVCGWTTLTEDAWGNVDRSTPDITASAESGVPDAEQLLTFAPDLYITITWANDDPLDYWGFPDQGSIDLVNSIAPIIAISATGLADVNTGRFAELAGLLGADLQSSELANVEADYAQSMAAFEATTSVQSALTSIFVYVEEAFLYVARPGDWADLAMYAAHGQLIVTPDAVPGTYWQELSLEQALLYPADVMFTSTRTGTFSVDEIKAHPTLGHHPAVLANQIGLWNQDFIMSYQGMTIALDGLRETLVASEKVT